MYVDLHIHTHYSDGVCSPAEVVAMARESDLQTIAITDHDTIDALDEAMLAGKQTGINVIPGIELSIDAEMPEDGHMHILGYFIDPGNSRLNESLHFLREARKTRVLQIIEKLRGLGIELSYEAVEQIAGESESPGRPHIASALIENGAISSRREAFEKYLAKGAPAYVEKKKLNPQEAIGLIREAGGIAVLAHPVLCGFKKESEIYSLIIKLKEIGLQGIEAYYPMHDPDQTAIYLKIARELGLAVTGGSDFHGYEDRKNIINQLKLNSNIYTELFRHYQKIKKEN